MPVLNMSDVERPVDAGVLVQGLGEAYPGQTVVQ